MLNTLLNQGQQFLNYQNHYKSIVSPHLKVIEETSGPMLGSIIEALENPNSGETLCKFKINGNCKSYPEMSNKSWFRDQDYGGPDPSTRSACKSRKQAWIDGCWGGSGTLSNNFVEMQYSPSEFEKLKMKHDKIFKELVDTKHLQFSRAEAGGDNSQLLSKVEKLDNQLLKILNKMEVMINNNLATSGGIAVELEKQRLQLLDKVLLLQQAEKNLHGASGGIGTLDGEYRDNKIHIKESYYRYIVWSVAAATLGFVAFKQMTK